MNGIEAMTGWKNLKQRLSFKSLGGCCGATWSPRNDPLALTIIHHQDQPDLHDDDVPDPPRGLQVQERAAGSHRVGNSVEGGMNLAMALARERNPPTKSLMRLIEETDGVADPGGGRGGSDWVCCVCMERGKGAAFIPCGHAFCRACSRELWLNRGSCPICNRSILDVLDIF